MYTTLNNNCQGRRILGEGKTVVSRYRVWIVRYEGCRPEAWHDLPAGAIAVEPAERGSMSARRARQYVEAFNRAAQGGRQKIWAVALPVAIRYVGDPQPGQAVSVGRNS
jgi:hypothetical protein